MYKILPYTTKQARKLGVHIQPSTRKYKKIDVFDRHGYYIVSVGDNRYLDYPYYLKLYGKKIAEQKRANYHSRHLKNNGSAGYYAKNLLW